MSTETFIIQQQPSDPDNRITADRRNIVATIPEQASMADIAFTERRTYLERRQNVASAAIKLLGNDDPRVEYSKAGLVDRLRSDMTIASGNFKQAVETFDVYEPTGSDRLTQITTTIDTESKKRQEWNPGRTYVYATVDPFQVLNPELVVATSNLISAAMEQAQFLKPSNDPELTYLSANRSAKGKKSTMLTELVKDIDPGISDWITNLPDAERLRPVANPWSDVSTLVRTPDKYIVEVPQTKALQVLVGSAGDGRAVREREAWERQVVREVIGKTALPGNKLTITSLGTGTGEPAMDTALEAMRSLYGDEEHSIEVNGFDINPNSLAIADYIASQKSENLTFRAGIANILSEEGIKKVVGGTEAQVYEAIGFAEYVPSDDAPTVMEQKQRSNMERAGCLSAQGFYKAIYDNMPEGSVLVTGNMRDDSPQASFVIDGLGWKGIIQRSTSDYMRILGEAGIPEKAVELYVPDSEKSAGVYNLVAITKSK